MKYKRYIVFNYDQYYPYGGLDDIFGSYDTLEEATKVLEEENACYIIDRDTWEEVE